MAAILPLTRKEQTRAAFEELACSKRSDSGERCEVKKAMKSRGGLKRVFFALLFTSHRSPVSERVEQAFAELKLLFAIIMPQIG